MADENIWVSYGIKELFAQINERLFSIDGKLDSKVDRHEHDALKAEVDQLKTQFNERLAVERDRVNARTTTFSKREKLIALAIAAAAVLVNVLPYLHGVPG